MEYRTDIFDELDRLSDGEECNIKAWEEEFKRVLATYTPEQRAYATIKGFFNMKNPTEEQHREFILYLVDERNAAVKEKMLERVFMEMMADTLVTEVN